MSATVALSSVADVIRGVTFSASDARNMPSDGALPILRAGDIGVALDVVTDLVWVDSALVSPDQRLRVGDIAICMSSGSASVVGKSAILSEPFDGSVGAFCALLRPGHDLDPAYLAHYLRSPAFWRWRDTAARGVGIQNLKVSDLQRLPVPLPPLNEQRRIAARLRARLAEIDSLQSNIASRIDTVRATAAALVETAFGLQSPDATVRAIGAVATVQTGYAFKSSWFRPSGVRLLRNANVLPDEVDWSDTVRLDPALAGSFSAYDLATGDIVLALDRPVIASGLKVARLGDLDAPSLLLQRVARLQPGPTIDADYLYGFMHTQQFMSAMSGHSQSLGVPHVSPRQVASVPIPLPPVAKQRRIAARLQKQLAEIDHAKAVLDAQRATINALPAALLREVFGPAVA